jgi:hypothetical protein
MITVTNLRKIFTTQGVKGASSWKREDFNAFIAGDHEAAIREDAARTPAPKAHKRGFCTDCGRKESFRGSDLCDQCREYAEWENAHSDGGHERGEDVNEDAISCPVCHPELDPRTPRKTGRSRAGMVIVAKGTEVHKSATFKAAAEAAGWTVEISVQEYEDGGTRHFADAHRGEDAIQLAWNGRAYDYDASSALLNGKSRKVRNLKEALRLI